jgi:hypothetical protein
VLARITAKPHVSALEEVSRALNADTTENNEQQQFNVTVAIQQNNILATAFHPELTDDLRWHRYCFVVSLFLSTCALFCSNRAFLQMVLHDRKQYQR